MKKHHLVLPTLLITLLFLSSATSSYGKNKLEGQLGAAIEWIPVPNRNDQFYMIQRTSDGKLILTPNESFFPKLGLRLEGTGDVPDVDLKLNGGKSFKTISQWNKGDQVEWGLWFEKTGNVKIQVWMAQTTSQDQYTVLMGEHEKTFTTRTVGNVPQIVATLSFKIKKAGRYSLLVDCNHLQNGKKTELHGIIISGTAVVNAAVLRKRWRPAAAHARFTSSHQPENVRLWVMEMDAKPGQLGFYCPITTPFGYYGPTWKADGTVSPGMNFSLWSFGAKQAEPPIEKLSHLIAIGNPQAKFSGFNHEGTGVKIRGWDPLKDQQGQSQVIALRVEPGEVYDTYFSYFYDHQLKQWRLFGIGNKSKQNNRPFKSLTLGSFVEVPGPPHVQRTGLYPRQMRYRGWVVDGKGMLHSLDQMSYGDIDKKTRLTYTNRGVTSDGRFYLETGGWTFRKAASQRNVLLNPARNNLKVEFLDPDDLSFLQSLPCEITGKMIKQTATGLEVTFHIRNLSKNPELELFWGNKEGLTFAERWDNSVTVNQLQEGNNQFLIKNVTTRKPTFVRLLLKNQQGQFWSMKTLKSHSR